MYLKIKRSAWLSRHDNFLLITLAAFDAQCVCSEVGCLHGERDANVGQGGVQAGTLHICI